MTKALTIRLPNDLLARADARAQRLGLDRTKYVRHLIELDLAGGDEEPPRRFASEDLAGAFELGGRPATNATTRERLRARSNAREENR